MRRMLLFAILVEIIILALLASCTTALWDGYDSLPENRDVRPTTARPLHRV